MKLIKYLFLLLTMNLALTACNSGSQTSSNIAPQPAPLSLGTFRWGESNLIMPIGSTKTVNLAYVGGSSNAYAFHISVQSSESNIASISPSDCQITPSGCVFTVTAESVGQSIITINSLVPFVTSLNLQVVEGAVAKQ